MNNMMRARLFQVRSDAPTTKRKAGNESMALYRSYGGEGYGYEEILGRIML